MTDNTENNTLQIYIENILIDYATTCKVPFFTGNVIISNNMAESYMSIREDLVNSGKTNLQDIQQYHGLTIQPKENNGNFTILLNQDYVYETVTKHNIDWIGTLVHEAVHVNDFSTYFDIVSPNSYDELYEYDLHRMFLYWTEFHARAIGHYFLRKYSLPNFKGDEHIKYILETELPFHINHLVKEVGASNNPDRQMYVVMHFLGRLAVWKYLYPNTFDDDFIKEITNSNPWMEELFNLLTQYDSLETIYPHFEEMERILDDYFFCS